ncbi:MAG TPA: DUF1801 domain-containing protein [Tepidisphaeraceae bacterium]|nr:DUF1801 domain-containing protein [Tepidisphaeraceae bacterium]
MVARFKLHHYQNLDADYEEGMQYGMIGYYVPHRVFSAGYHCDPRQPLPFAALASQKNHMALYLMSVYCGCVPGEESAENQHAAWFQKAWRATGNKLDMGKACVRFKNLDDVPLDVVGEAIKRIPAKMWIDVYTSSLAASKKKSPPAKAKSTTVGAVTATRKKTR